MTTSNSTVFNLTRDQIINGALRILGVLSTGQTAESNQITEAAEALNIFIKALEAEGMPLWGMVDYAVPLTAATSTYQIGLGKTINTPKPLKVVQAWNHDSVSNVDIPMRLLTRQEYSMLGNKTSAGNPIQYYYQPKLDYGELHVFPVPSSTEAANNTIYITYQRTFEDFLVAGDTPDFPQEWLETLKYGLAVRLASEYGIDAESRRLLLQEYMTIKNAALSFGTEEGSLFFGIDRRWY
jgi:hypothetical protein